MKDVSKESLKRIVNRNFQEDFKWVIGLPMDSKRNDVEPGLINDYYEKLKKNISKEHQYFIFNFDEVCVQDLQNASQ